MKKYCVSSKEFCTFKAFESSKNFMISVEALIKPQGIRKRNYLVIFISWSRERSKGKLVLQNYFLLTMFIVDVWPCRCLNKPWILNMSEFWIYRGSKYTRVLNMFLILNMLGFWIYHGSKYDRFTQGLNMPE